MGARWTPFCKNTMVPAWREGRDIAQTYVDYFKPLNKFEDADRKYLQLEYMKYSTSAGRQWWYQTCTEYGYFQTAPLLNSLRS